MHEPKTGLRILAVIVNLVPYHGSRWTAVAEAGHEVTLLQRRATDPFAVLSIAAERLPFNVQTMEDPLAGGISWRDQLLAWIERVEPHVLVVSGYSYPESLAAMQAAAERGIRVVVCSESNAHDAPRRPWTEALKRRLLRLAQAALVGGDPQAAYLESLGLPASSIFRGYNAVDNHHFASALDWRQQGAQARQRLGLPSRYLLAVSRFIDKKNLVRLIDGFHAWWLNAPLDQQELSLMILGDGPLRAALEAQVERLSLQGRVVLPGACTYADLPSRYGLAEAFIHPSTVEQWGLVVNEAMAAGLPVLVSATCGCAPELVQPGVTGQRFLPYDAESISEAIAWLFSLPQASRQRLGEASQRRVSTYGPEAFAAGLEAAALHALGQSPRGLSQLDRLLLQRLSTRVVPYDA